MGINFTGFPTTPERRNQQTENGNRTSVEEALASLTSEMVSLI